MKRLKWILALTVLVAVSCAVQVTEITKPARVKKVSNKDNIKQYHVVVSQREGAEQVFLFMKVKRPVASVILFAGGGGTLNIENGVINQMGGNFVVRSRFRFASEGFNVAVVDAPSDYRNLRGARDTLFHAVDIKGVIAYLREASDVPVWLIGTSRGTISAANAASRLKEGGADGVVLISTVFFRGAGGSLFDVDLEGITVPTLFVHHKKDRCSVSPYTPGAPHMKGLRNAPKVEQIVFEEGLPDKGRFCSGTGPHGFRGIRDEVVRAIGNWIKANNPR